LAPAGGRAGGNCPRGAGRGSGFPVPPGAVASLPSDLLASPSSGKDHRWQGPDPFGSPDVKRAMNSQEGKFPSTYDHAHDTGVSRSLTQETERLNLFHHT